MLDSDSDNEMENTQDLLYSKNDAKAANLSSSDGDEIDLDLS